MSDPQAQCDEGDDTLVNAQCQSLKCWSTMHGQQFISIPIVFCRTKMPLTNVSYCITKYLDTSFIIRSILHFVEVELSTYQHTSACVIVRYFPVRY